MIENSFKFSPYLFLFPFYLPLISSYPSQYTHTKQEIVLSFVMQRQNHEQTGLDKFHKSLKKTELWLQDK